MSGLNKQELQLVFDYCIGVATQQETSEAQRLISSDPQAAKLHLQLTMALRPLGALEPERCPEYLSERTVTRLNNLARAGAYALEKLLSQEQMRRTTVRSGFWRNLAEVAAMAAVIILFAGISIPSLNSARRQAWQVACQAQLGRIATAMTQYASDNDGSLPSVPMVAGAPWWKVGYQGQENHSNTRHLWLLVNCNYAEPADFVCPGRSQGRAVELHRVHVKKLLDFPARRNVTYSFRIMPGEKVRQLPDGHTVLMADLSPVFENICEELPTGLPATNSFAPVKLCEKLLRTNTVNHDGRGQNLMFADGRVVFSKQRIIGVSFDDIFTVKGKDCYTGCEMPASEDDMFLAP